MVQSNRFHTNSARTEQGRTDLLDHIRGRGRGRDDAAFLRRSPPAVGSSPLGTYACSTWRTEQNLDVLRVDDQISTGQHAEVWSTCHRLADAARRWWTELEAIVYRSRTTPTTSANFAFFTADAFPVESCGSSSIGPTSSPTSCCATVSQSTGTSEVHSTQKVNGPRDAVPGRTRTNHDDSHEHERPLGESSCLTQVVIAVTTRASPRPSTGDGCRHDSQVCAALWNRSGAPSNAWRRAVSGHLVVQRSSGHGSGLSEVPVCGLALRLGNRLLDIGPGGRHLAGPMVPGAAGTLRRCALAVFTAHNGVTALSVRSAGKPVGDEIDVVGLGAQQVPGDDEDGMSDRQGGFTSCRCASRGARTGREVAVAFSGGRPRTLHQHVAQPWIAATCVVASLSPRRPRTLLARRGLVGVTGLGPGRGRVRLVTVTR